MKYPSFIFLLVGLLLPGVGCQRGTDGAAAECVPIDTARSIARHLSRTARLYTAEYKVRKVVTYGDEARLKGSVLMLPVDLPLTLGSRKVAIPVDVTLRAYVDFSGFTEGQVERTDGGITVLLPDPRIVVTASRIDNKGVRQYVDFPRSRFTDSELLALARQGQDSIVRHADCAEILRTAQRNAAQSLLPLLHRMGYDPAHCRVTFRNDLDVRNLRLEYAE